MPAIHPIWIIIVTALMALLPIALGLVTSFVKVNIVLSMVRNALGTQQIPGTIIVMALSCALTAFIMGPVCSESLEKCKGLDFAKILQAEPSVDMAEKLGAIFEPWRNFMQLHVGRREIEALLAIDAQKTQSEKKGSDLKPLQPASPSLRVLLPAFLLSELRQAFSMGFLVLLPFLVIDLIVANVLAGMGMYMMSPVLVSLPVKLLVFVLSDAWLIIVRGLVLSYH